jgi:hypothetical protein
VCRRAATDELCQDRTNPPTTVARVVLRSTTKPAAYEPICSNRPLKNGPFTKSSLPTWSDTERKLALFAVYAAEGRPDDPLSALKIGERPRPEVPGKHVAVNVRAASLNMHDLRTLRGVGISSHMFPMTLGMDGAGVTDDGREVVIHSVIPSTGWQGDETLDPRRSILSERYQGTFADRVIVPESNILPKLPAMSFNEAACMGTAWLTAYRMLFVKSGLRPGQTILVQGSSGGVPTALVQLARATGFRVWATGRTAEKRTLAIDLGAHATFEPGARLPERVAASLTVSAIRPGSTPCDPSNPVVSSSRVVRPPAMLLPLNYNASSTSGFASSGRQWGHEMNWPTCSLSVPTPASTPRSPASSQWMRRTRRFDS